MSSFSSHPPPRPSNPQPMPEQLPQGPQDPARAARTVQVAEGLSLAWPVTPVLEREHESKHPGTSRAGALPEGLLWVGQLGLHGLRGPELSAATSCSWISGVRPPGAPVATGQASGSSPAVPAP